MVTRTGENSSGAKLRVFIVDDEPLSRSRVKSFLGSEISVEYAGEADNGNEALALIHKELPDIVFLDVQMPGCDGMEVLDRLPEARRPAVVLMTAYSKFAVEAFAARVVDFLLKPFDRGRFNEALGHAIDHVRSRRASDLGARLEHMLAQPQKKAPERLAVRADGRVLFVKSADIIWVEAANNYCTLHLAGSKRLLIRETLTSVEERLGGYAFVRVNRSAVVHFDQIQELQPAKYGDYLVVLRDGTRISLSRNLRGRLGKFLPEES